jgi:hypothetical protein
LRGRVLIPLISIRNYGPRTFGESDIEKKKELRNKLSASIGSHLEEYRESCKQKLLSIEIAFYLYKDKEIGSPRDLDNMLKILCDTFPDFVDRAMTEAGLGLISGNSDHTIYEIHSMKRLVDNLTDEGVDLEVFEWSPDTSATNTPNNIIRQAEEFAKYKHRCQYRKDQKTPYWHHLAQVVNNLRSMGIKDENILCAGWLHDTLEDTDTDFDEIAEKFNPEIGQMVADVSKNKTLQEREREIAYKDKLRVIQWQSQVIKFSDVMANIADLPTGYSDPGVITAQIEKKLEYIEAIRPGLSKASLRIPGMNDTMRAFNKILAPYGRKFSL